MRVIDLAASRDLIVADTKFSRKYIPKGTWVSPAELLALELITCFWIADALLFAKN